MRFWFRQSFATALLALACPASRGDDIDALQRRVFVLLAENAGVAIPLAEQLVQEGGIDALKVRAIARGHDSREMMTLAAEYRQLHEKRKAREREALELAALHGDEQARQMLREKDEARKKKREAQLRQRLATEAGISGDAAAKMTINQLRRLAAGSKDQDERCRKASLRAWQVILDGRRRNLPPSEMQARAIGLLGDPDLNDWQRVAIIAECFPEISNPTPLDVQMAKNQAEMDLAMNVAAGGALTQAFDADDMLRKLNEGDVVRLNRFDKPQPYTLEVIRVAEDGLLVKGYRELALIRNVDTTNLITSDYVGFEQELRVTRRSTTPDGRPIVVLVPTMQWDRTVRPMPDPLVSERHRQQPKQ